MVKALRAGSIPAAALIIIATNATSNQTLRENLWAGLACCRSHRACRIAAHGAPMDLFRIEDLNSIAE